MGTSEAGSGLTGITFTRLTAVDPVEVQALLNEPRHRRHLPLAGAMDQRQTAEWVRTKDAQWEEHGHGPWAVLVDGDFAGWGGFQREPAGVDFALVLLPRFWGAGEAVTRLALSHGFGVLGFESVLIALPSTRRADRAVSRLGFVADGEVTYGGVVFQQYRLTRAAFLARLPGGVLGAGEESGPRARSRR